MQTILNWCDKSGAIFPVSGLFKFKSDFDEKINFPDSRREMRANVENFPIANFECSTGVS